LSTRTSKLVVFETYDPFYLTSLFHSLEHIDIACPLLQFEKVGNPVSGSYQANIWNQASSPDPVLLRPEN